MLRQVFQRIPRPDFAVCGGRGRTSGRFLASGSGIRDLYFDRTETNGPRQGNGDCGTDGASGGGKQAWQQGQAASGGSGGGGGGGESKPAKKRKSGGKRPTVAAQAGDAAEAGAPATVGLDVRS
ncbi:hypothetical protein D9Q98_004116 [Chlorella vulgaris]|uniref:Uncharacterized protein n=1 Tax=Chlorella vulgaris TaxID=3077 RepID=A0A9D4YYQ8_CHLVU|nr:hypothetical protein D9Q98_004116 [Chlorella vulgaris]